MEGPWEHPDWYDLHDNAWTAGPGREPEHYREFVIALPPLDRDDHLIDAGAGTGKLARMVADAYPNLGQVTLIDPNARKLVRAAGRIAEALPDARVQTIEANLGAGAPLPRAQGSLISIGSVLMPIMELRGRTLADGITWLRSVLGEVQNMLRPGGWLYDLETLGAPWAGGALNDPVRRMKMLELTAEIQTAGFQQVECVYRFRDRVILRGQKPDA